MVESLLHEAVCIQRPELWQSWLHEAVCRQRPELWLRVGYMKLCVYRYLDGG